MYFLFRFHGWKPQEYYEMGNGAKKVIAAFMHQEIDDRRQELEALGNVGE